MSTNKPLNSQAHVVAPTLSENVEQVYYENGGAEVSDLTPEQHQAGSLDPSSEVDSSNLSEAKRSIRGKGGTGSKEFALEDDTTQTEATSTDNSDSLTASPGVGLYSPWRTNRASSRRSGLSASGRPLRLSLESLVDEECPNEGKSIESQEEDRKLPASPQHGVVTRLSVGDLAYFGFAPEGSDEKQVDDASHPILRAKNLLKAITGRSIGETRQDSTTDQDGAISHPIVTANSELKPVPGQTAGADDEDSNEKQFSDESAHPIVRAKTHLKAASGRPLEGEQGFRASTGTLGRMRSVGFEQNFRASSGSPGRLRGSGNSQREFSQSVSGASLDGRHGSLSSSLRSSSRDLVQAKLRISQRSSHVGPGDAQITVFSEDSLIEDDLTPDDLTVDDLTLDGNSAEFQPTQSRHSLVDVKNSIRSSRSSQNSVRFSIEEDNRGLIETNNEKEYDAEQGDLESGTIPSELKNSNKNGTTLEAQVVDEEEERKRYFDETRRSLEAGAVVASVVDVRKRRIGLGLLLLLSIAALSIGIGMTVANTKEEAPPAPTVQTTGWIQLANDFTLSNQTLNFPPLSETPEELALEWLVRQANLTVPLETARQRFAFTVLSFAFGYPEWRDPHSLECDLKGVGCGVHGEVDYVYARQQNMTGTIPSDLALLSKLTHLTLSRNDLEGTIPWDEMMNEMTELEFLDLDYCFFSGPIPSPKNGTWTKLEKLWLAENMLTGTISPGFTYWTSLQHIYAPENQLHGSFPSELATLSQLTWFSLYDNAFTGSLPSEFGLWTELRFFEVSRNQLNSSFPTEFSQWSHLNDFQPQRNMFSGSIPSAFGQWTKLKVLEVDYNKLTGSLPSEVGQWTLLTHLRVDNNQFRGSLPSEIGKWTDLQRVFMNGNDFTGTIPMNVLNWTDVADGYFHQTSFEGTVPFCVEEVDSLFTLYADCCDVSCPCCSNCFYDANGASTNCTDG